MPSEGRRYTEFNWPQNSGEIPIGRTKRNKSKAKLAKKSKKKNRR